MVFADDLSAFREFGGMVPNADVMESMRLCQGDLHQWGRANQVALIPRKKACT